jgi:heme/copper-type cytochrome/quinol oxidase subunit 3
LFIDHFTIQHHFGFEAAAFYWHFVDGVAFNMFYFVTFCRQDAFITLVFG